MCLANRKGNIRNIRDFLFVCVWGEEGERVGGVEKRKRMLTLK